MLLRLCSIQPCVLASLLAGGTAKIEDVPIVPMEDKKIWPPCKDLLPLRPLAVDRRSLGMRDTIQAAALHYN